MTQRFISINDRIASTFFDVSSNDVSKIKMVFSMVGKEPCLEHYPINVEFGKAEFQWDSNVRSLEEGWYESELMVNGCPCGKYPTFISNSCESAFAGNASRDGWCPPDGTCVGPRAPEVSCSKVLCPQPVVCPEIDVCNVTDNRPAVYVPAYRI